MRVVLDTNILVSGIAYPNGAPGKTVSAWLAGQFDLVLSETLIEEFARVLRYPKLVKVMRRAHLSEQDLNEYLDMFRIKAVVVATHSVRVPVAPPDPKDVPILEAFYASGAEFLVTGDRKDLLSLGIPGVLSAPEFVSRLESFQATRQDSHEVGPASGAMAKPEAPEGSGST
jgi:putative PIN family toxin of toxin-antitoxin system